MELDVSIVESILEDSYRTHSYIVVDCDYDTLNNFFHIVIPVLWPWYLETPSDYSYATYLWHTYKNNYKPYNKKLAICCKLSDNTYQRFGYDNDAYYRSEGYQEYSMTLSEIIYMASNTTFNADELLALL